MKLSDAMILGSCSYPMMPGLWSNCALGVAASAVGIPQQRHRYRAIVERWPWLGSHQEEKLAEIAEMFDNKVCVGLMTFEELVEYVRSIEPACVCGSFDCCCARVEHLLHLADATPAASHTQEPSAALP